MALHDGHRDRLRQRFAEEGLDSFSDVQILELLLFHCIARRDTNPIAHRLLERFGSLSQVMEAPVRELVTVEGMGENAARFLHLVVQAGRAYQRDRGGRIRLLGTLEDCAEYILPHYVGRTVETVFLLCMDAKCKPLCCKLVSEGNVNTAGVSIRRIVEQALAANATSVVLAHNHPGGLALPSAEDIQTTRKVAAALKAVEITLADHIIIADGDYVSLAQSGCDLSGEPRPESGEKE